MLSGSVLEAIPEDDWLLTFVGLDKIIQPVNDVTNLHNNAFHYGNKSKKTVFAFHGAC